MNRARPSSPSTKPETAAAQEEIGAIMLHRGCSGIDEISQLSPGYMVFVCHRPHDAAHGQAVEIIVNKISTPRTTVASCAPTPVLIFLDAQRPKAAEPPPCS